MIHRISGFGTSALNTDAQATMLQQGEWNVMHNIDLESGDIRSAWGDTLISANCPITPLYTFVYEATAGTYLIVSNGDLVYTYDNSTWTDITPIDGPVTPNEWDTDDGVVWDDDTTVWDQNPGGAPAETGGVVTFTVFLGILVIGFSEGTPAYWPETSTRMVALPGWPTGWHAQQIISYRNFLFAIGLNDTTTAGPKYTVGWSDAAGEGQVPGEWTPTSENFAGLLQLRDTDGYLVVARILRDDLIIYKNDTIYRLYFTGDEFVFGVERVVSDRGCDSINGVTGLGDVHFFADRGDIRLFDGQQTKSVAIARIKERLSSAISNESRDRTIVVAYPERDEVWVAVVPAGSTTADIVLVYSTVFSAWTAKRYPDTISMILGPYSTTSIDLDDAWDEYTGTWDDSEDTWDRSAYEPSEDGIIFGAGSELYRADKTHTDRNGLAKTCIAERSGFVIPDIGHRVTLRAVYPEMEGPGTVQIQIGAQWHAGGGIRWTTPQSFTPGYSKKLNVRMTGQPVAFRVKSSVTNGWRLGAMSFDVVEAGRR